MTKRAVSSLIVASTLAALLAGSANPAVAETLCSSGKDMVHIVPPASYRGPFLSHFYESGTPASLVGDQGLTYSPCPGSEPEPDPVPETVVVLIDTSD